MADNIIDICHKTLTEGQSVLLEASAGTGKTFTITRTVRKIQQESRIPAEQILILTFTEKAINEMKSKLLEAFSGDPHNISSQLPVFTIDGYFSAVLKNHLYETGVDPDYSLVSPDEIRNFLVQSLLRKEWPQNSELEKKLNRIFASGEKTGENPTEKDENEEIDPNKLADTLVNWLQLTEQTDADFFIKEQYPEFKKDIESLYLDLRHRYQKMLATNNLKTYASILDDIHHLSETKQSEIHSLVRNQYRFVFIDEFQDTNKKQWEVFQNLFEANNIPLCLVGDPKQAIYAFRQADLENYLTIRESIKQQTEHWKILQLDTNWRSTERMVHALNSLFTDEKYLQPDKDFFLMNNRLEFHPVKPSGDTDKNDKLKKIAEISKPINIIIQPDEKSASGKASLNSFISKEIERLVKDRFCSYSDICILVEKKQIYYKLRPYLKNLNIPHFYYKEDGILKSEAAHNFKHLLEAIATPDSSKSFKTALLTSFFGKSLSDLTEDFSGSSEENLYFSLTAAAEERKWHEFFRLLRTSAVWFSAQDRSNRDSERMVTDYRQLFEMLEDFAIREQCDIEELAEYFAHAQRKASSEYDLNLHSGTESKEKVQIMTMHQSKGLEFPVVFSLLNHNPNENKVSFPVLLDIADDDSGSSRKFVYLSNDENDHAKKLAREKMNREQRRLAYVAFTRAKYLLYIPAWKTKNNEHKNKLTFQLGSIAENENNPYYNVIPLTENTSGNAVFDSYLSEPSSVRLPLAEEIHQREGTSKELYSRSRKITSYSSLSREKKIESPLIADAREKEIDEPMTTDAEIQVENILPKGAETGLMLHELLEHCDFSTLHRNNLSLENLLTESRSEKSSLAIISLARDLQKKYHLKPANLTPGANGEQIIISEALKIIWHTVNAQIPELGISLADLKTEDCMKELQFLFQPNEKIAGTSVRPQLDFVTGVIDLVFKYNNHVYFADYKSNTIPENLSLKDFDRLEFDMQRNFYRTAIELWLKEKSFKYGGNYYFYLRYCQAPGDTGILRGDHDSV